MYFIEINGGREILLNECNESYEKIKFIEQSDVYGIREITQFEINNINKILFYDLDI